MVSLLTAFYQRFDVSQGLEFAAVLAASLAVAAGVAFAAKRAVKPHARSPLPARWKVGQAPTVQNACKLDRSAGSTVPCSSPGMCHGAFSVNQQTLSGEQIALEATIERIGSEAWGFAWHVGAHAERRLIVARVDPSSPVGQWCAAEKLSGRRGIEHGDEILNVNGSDEYSGIRRELASAGKVMLRYRPAAAENLTGSSNAVGGGGGGGVKGALARRRAAKAASQGSAPNSPCSGGGQSSCSHSGAFLEAVAPSNMDKQAINDVVRSTHDNNPVLSPSSSVSRKLPSAFPHGSAECFVKNTFIEVCEDGEIDHPRFSRSDPLPILDIAASIPRASLYIPGSLAGFDLDPPPSGNSLRCAAHEGTVPKTNGSSDSSGTWASAESSKTQWPHVPQDTCAASNPSTCSALGCTEPMKSTEAAEEHHHCFPMSASPISIQPLSGASMDTGTLVVNTPAAGDAPLYSGPVLVGFPCPRISPVRPLSPPTAHNAVAFTSSTAGALVRHSLQSSSAAPSAGPQLCRHVPPSLDELQTPSFPAAVPAATYPPSGSPGGLGAAPVVSKNVPVPDLGPMLTPFAPPDANVEDLAATSTNMPFGTEEVTILTPTESQSGALDSSSAVMEPAARRKPTRRGGRRARYRRLAAVARQQGDAGMEFAKDDDCVSSEDPDQHEQLQTARLMTRPISGSWRLPSPMTKFPSMFPDIEELVGKRVLIFGLVRSPEFNLHWGLVESYDTRLQRYVVRIHLGNTGDNQVLAKLRRENLILPQAGGLQFSNGPTGQASASEPLPNSCMEAMPQQVFIPGQWPWCVVPPPAVGAETSMSTEVAATPDRLLPQAILGPPVQNPGPATEFKDSGGGSLLRSPSQEAHQTLATQFLLPKDNLLGIPRSPGPAADFEDSVGLSLVPGTPHHLREDTLACLIPGSQSKVSCSTLSSNGLQTMHVRTNAEQTCRRMPEASTVAENSANGFPAAAQHKSVVNLPSHTSCSMPLLADQGKSSSSRTNISGLRSQAVDVKSRRKEGTQERCSQFVASVKNETLPQFSWKPSWRPSLRMPVCE